MDLSIAMRLNDCYQKIDINKHFKVAAGPGAGKTRFIINHINNIIASSPKIAGLKKIACITYTNTGVETITNRLDSAIENVEVSTIHSFLYKNVVKPYLWILKNQYVFNYSKIDGHDEVIPTFSLLKAWKESTGQQRIKNDQALTKALIKLQWRLDDKGKIELRFKNVWDGKVDNYNIKKSSYMEYKKLCWERGLISHDDVLYLSYEIIVKEPRVLEIIRGKFPYVLIDEFQDTNPIQTEIVKMIAEKECVIGVIGDECQSIYSFQGADVRQFIDFSLPNMELYYIENNHRSTEQIISILNYIRDDDAFHQESPDHKIGKTPKLLIGKFFDAYKRVLELCQGDPLYTLSFRNDLANMIKYGIDGCFSENITDEFIFSDNDRGKMIFYVIHSLEYCRENKVKEAIKFMKKAYRKVALFDDKDALVNIKRLFNQYSLFSEMNIKEFYNNYLYGFYDVKSKIMSGNANNYYQQLIYNKVACVINISDDNGKFRTIHKAKGGEFQNVLLLMQPKENYDEEKELAFLLNPNMQEEEQRVYYVAVSRAMENLFICAPQLSNDNRKRIRGFDILDV